MKNNQNKFNRVLFVIKCFLPAFFFLSINFIWLNLGYLNRNFIVNRSEIVENTKVLGSRTPQIFIKGSNDEYGAGGMISLASTDEPEIKISSYNSEGQANLTLYKTDEGKLLQYLIYDGEGKQKNKDISTDGMQEIKKIDFNISKGNDNSSVRLPLEESGIWYAKIEHKNIIENAFIVRSKNGVLLKKGDNEFIFWGQNFESKKSINSGELELLSLFDSVKKIASGKFDSTGLAKSKISGEADIALIRIDGDISIVPINLKYIGYYYNEYKEFKIRERNSRFFIFTDRPLYIPGDKVNFKTIIRDDDDGNYTIPKGEALVRIFSGWDEKDKIYEKTYSISEEGTVFGEYVLEKDAKVGNYRIEVILSEEIKSTIYFDVQNYRKPEYFVDLEVNNDKYISGDKLTIIIKGEYFSGKPLTGGQVKYKIYSADFYDYQYEMDNNYLFNDNYRYGFWYGEIINEGTVLFNSNGRTEVNFQTLIPETNKSNQVYSIEIEYTDGSVEPAFARKNVLVYSGEYGIYRKKDSVNRAKLGEEFQMPLVLIPNMGLDVNVKNVDLNAKLIRSEWVKEESQNSKYPIWKEVKEEMGESKLKTDRNGETVYKYKPSKTGSYKIEISGIDSHKNNVFKEFSFYVSDKDYISYSQNEGLNISAEKDNYKPSEKAKLLISSAIKNRDVFLTVDRSRVFEYRIVNLENGEAEVNIDLKESYMPNIYVSVSSFSQDYLDTAFANIPVSAEEKRLLIDIKTDKENYGPKDTVNLALKTSDGLGNNVASDLAIWTVDKALFQLVDRNNTDIFDEFWQDRYYYSSTSHSLAGIIVRNSEMGGGCFSSETKILMANNKEKRIDELKVGDKILTRKSATDESLVKAEIEKIHKANVSSYLIINYDTKVTAEHRLWVNGDWKLAGEIVVGDLLSDSSGEEIRVFSVEGVKGDFQVYNLEVKNYRTFFANNFWVHNQKGGIARTEFKDTAYWNPSVKTDSSGNAKISFKLPDNLTTWMIMGLGSNKETVVGDAFTEIKVNKDIVISPNVPNILRVGDKITFSALVNNYSEKERNFGVSMDFSSGKIKEATYSGVLIKPNQGKEIYWDVEVTKENPNADIVFTVWDEGQEQIGDRTELKVSVVPFGFSNKYAFSKVEEANYQVGLSKNISKEKSSVKLNLSASLTGNLVSGMKYLINYPYGCTEQITSSFVPIMVAKNNTGIFAKAFNSKDIDKMANKGIELLIQKRKGGLWSWWDQKEVNLFVSSYVLENLKTGRELGYEVPEYIFLDANSYVYNLEVKTNRDEVLKKYIAKICNYQTNIEDVKNFDGLSADILSLAVMFNYKNGNKNPVSNGVSILKSMAKNSGDGLYWEAGDKEDFGSIEASTALALRALILASPDSEEQISRAAKFLTRNRTNDYWVNTFATAQTVMALTDYVKLSKELVPNYSYSVLIDGKVLENGKVTNLDFEKEINISLDKIGENNSKIEIKKTGEGMIYSTLSVDEFLSDKNAKAFGNGISIERDYVNEKGGNNIGVGDLVTVKLKVSGLKTNELYGVIDDSLPSGLVAVNENFKNEQMTSDGAYSSFGDIKIDGKVLSIYSLPSGEKIYSYKARAVNEGEFHAPPAQVSLMYAPEISARSGVDIIKIGKRNFEISDTIKNLTNSKNLFYNLYFWLGIIGLALVAVLTKFVILLKNRNKIKLSNLSKEQNLNEKRENLDANLINKDKDEKKD